LAAAGARWPTAADSLGGPEQAARAAAIDSPARQTATRVIVGTIGILANFQQDHRRNATCRPRGPTWEIMEYAGIEGERDAALMLEILENVDEEK
jgi:hypothetical protein